MGGKFYAVRVGRRPGIYNDWLDVKPEVEGYPGAQHKSFKSREAAEMYLSSGPSVAVGGKRSRADVDDDGFRHGDGYGRDNSYLRGPPQPALGNPYCRSGDGGYASRPPEPLANRQNYQLPTSGNPSGVGSGSGSRFNAVVEGPLQPIRSDSVYEVEFDGAARGNPGQAGCGALLRRQDTGVVVCRLRKYMGSNNTNNEAEYTALLEGLKLARRMGATRVHAKGDSKLVVNQVQGIWRINKDHLQVLCDQVQDEVRRFTEFKIRHIPREWNGDADKLSNDAIDLA